MPFPEEKYTGYEASIVWDYLGERIAFCFSSSDDYRIWVWDVKNNKSLQELQGHSSQVTSLAWDSANEHIASGSWDKTVRIWNVSTGKEIHCFTLPTPITGLSWRPLSKYLAVSGGKSDTTQKEGTVRIWDSVSGEEISCLTHPDVVWSVQWDKRGDYLISGCSDGGIRIWEGASGKCLQIIQLPERIKQVAWRKTNKNWVLFAVFGTSITCYHLDLDFSNPRLQWLTASKAIFNLSVLNVAETSNLSILNQSLLKQRGALQVPEKILEEKGEKIISHFSLAELTIFDKAFYLEGEKHPGNDEYLQGVCCRFGHFQNIDSQKALTHFTAAAELGHPDAYFQLGEIYEQGCGVVVSDQKIAQSYYEKAFPGIKVQAESKKNGWAAFALASMYERGLGTEQNWTEAEIWYQVAVPLLKQYAQKGVLNAQLYLGICYQYGSGVPTDLDQAAILFQAAADCSYAPAQIRLISFSENGLGGLRKNLLQAGTHCMAAALTGEPYAKSTVERFRPIMRKNWGATSDSVLDPLVLSSAEEKLGYHRRIDVRLNSFHHAVLTNDLFMVKQLLKQSVSVHQKNQKGLTPLQIIIQGNNEEMANLIYESEYKIQINSATKENYLSWMAEKAVSYLFQNIRACNVSLVRLLLEMNLQVDQLSLWGSTPLAVAAEARFYYSSKASELAKQTEIIRLLIEHGAPVDQETANGFTPLLNAVFRGNVPITKALLESKADVNRPDQEEQVTALSIATEDRDENMISLLKSYHGRCYEGEKIKIISAQMTDADRDYFLGETAHPGDSDYLAGICYRRGFGVKIDFPKALVHFKKAAETGHPRAQFYSALMYENGEGTLPDKIAAQSLYQSCSGAMLSQAESKKDAFAARFVAIMYEEGSGLIKDLGKATHWYQLAIPLLITAARKRVLDACYALGFYYEWGYIVDKDPVQAARWYRLPANRGYALTQYVMGTCYEKGQLFQGKGVRKDIPFAIHWYQLASSQGLPLAEKKMSEFKRMSQLNLTMPLEEKSFPEPNDDVEGLMAMSAVEEKYYLGKTRHDADGDYLKGVRYYYGYGTKINFKKALEFFTKAAKKGHLRSQAYLAEIGNNPIGRELLDEQLISLSKDNCEREINYQAKEEQDVWALYYVDFFDEVVRLFPSLLPDDPGLSLLRKAAEQGVIQAIFLQGKSYALGANVEQVWMEAVKAYQIAAGKGHPGAQCQLAHCYRQGNGVTQSNGEALSWYHKAAENGDIEAQYTLGEIYEMGRIVETDYAEAVKWYQQVLVQQKYFPLNDYPYFVDRGAKEKLNKFLEIQKIINNVSGEINKAKQNPQQAGSPVVMDSATPTEELSQSLHQNARENEAESKVLVNTLKSDQDAKEMKLSEAELYSSSTTTGDAQGSIPSVNLAINLRPRGVEKPVATYNPSIFGLAAVQSFHPVGGEGHNESLTEPLLNNKSSSDDHEQGLFGLQGKTKSKKDKESSCCPLKCSIL